MNENETNQELVNSEEVLETTSENNQEVSEQEITKDESELSEVEKLKKQVQTLQAQKEHFKKKASEKSSEKADSSANDVLTRDEVVLIANGMTLDEMDQLKVIQKGSGLSLKEALNSPMFKAYQKEQEAEKKRKKAALGASGGSGSGSELKAKPGMTEAEHRELWKKYQK